MSLIKIICELEPLDYRNDCVKWGWRAVELIHGRGKVHNIPMRAVIALLKEITNSNKINKLWRIGNKIHDPKIIVDEEYLTWKKEMLKCFYRGRPYKTFKYGKHLVQVRIQCKKR